jgi:chromosomal replication initiation ATPase DnaA
MKFENLVVGQFNEMAVKASEMVIENPGRDYPVLIMQGGLRSGKSFLIIAIESRASLRLSRVLAVQ